MTRYVNLSPTSYRPVRTSPCSSEMFSCFVVAPSQYAELKATNPTLLACNQPCLPVSRRVRATALDAGRVLIGNKIMMTILKIFKLGGVSLVLCGMMEVTAMEG